MDRIGVRELRQHASRYLARVAAGERLEITDRGHPVALLVPVTADVWEDLLASGRVAPPSEPGDLIEDAPRDYGVDASASLAESRDAER